MPFHISYYAHICWHAFQASRFQLGAQKRAPLLRAAYTTARHPETYQTATFPARATLLLRGLSPLDHDDFARPMMGAKDAI